MPPFINRRRRDSSPELEPPPKRTKTAASTPTVTKVKEKGGTTVKKPKQKKKEVRIVSGKAERKATVFDSIDKQQAARKFEESSRFFAQNGDSDSDDLSSDPDSDEFEDIPTKAQAAKAQDEVSDDEEEDWEDTVHDPVPEAPTEDAPEETLELNLGGPRNADVTYAEISGGKKQGPSKREKKMRELAHSIHVQYLMWHNHVRNYWLNDNEVQKIMVRHLTQSQKMKVQLESWKRKAGIVEGVTRPPPKSENSRSNTSGKSQSHTPRKGDPRSERDWGLPAERQAVGEPDMSQGDPLQKFLNVLATWWKQKFTITAPGLRKHGYKSVRDLKDQVQSWRQGDFDIREHGERITDLKEFRSYASRCEGSRDVGIHLFVALLRGLGIEARMVSSLQPLGFGFTKVEEAEVKPKKVTEQQAQTKAIPKKPAKSKQSQQGTGSKADAISLSDTSDLSELPDAGHDDDDESDASIVDVTPKRKANMPYDRDLLCPNYWVEAISSLTHRVFPVDPFLLQPSVATNPEHLSLFEPRGAKAEKARQVFAYVIAFSSDYTAKDVTVRYLRKHIWPGKTKGFRLPSAKFPVHNRHGKVRGYYEIDWWKTVIGPYLRPQSKRTVADDIEDQGDLKPMQPEKKAPKEGVPDTLDGFKRSTEYVLARHLRREEALLPTAASVATFKSGKGAKLAEDLVYLRKDVVVTRTGESWHKEGREVKVGAQALKYVPIRAVTMTRKREIEEIERETGEKATQGMYSRDQTDWIIPPPIKDGVIPKNAYGNMDAFVPQMIPKGAVHIPLRGTVRVCKKLEIDFAEAVTGFEFGNKMAVPVIQGVVVASENRKLVMDAWNKAEEDRKLREAAKQEKLVLGTWRKFLMGLRIVERMREEYEIDIDGDQREEINPFTNPNRKSPPAKENGDQSSKRKPYPVHTDVQMDGEDLIHDTNPWKEDVHVANSEQGGGFFPEGYNEIPAKQNRNDAQDSEDVDIDIDEDAARNRPKAKGQMRSLAEIAAQSTRKAETDDSDELADLVNSNSHPVNAKKEAKRKTKAEAKPKRAPPRRASTRQAKIEEEDKEEEEEETADDDADESEEEVTITRKTTRRTRPAKV